LDKEQMGKISALRFHLLALGLLGLGGADFEIPDHFQHRLQFTLNQR